jgi:hypothetical protein
VCGGEKVGHWSGGVMRLRAAQREIFGNTERQPYVTTGVFPQCRRSVRQDTPAILKGNLDHALDGWGRITKAMEASMKKPKPDTSNINFCELKHVLEDAQTLLSDRQLLEVADDMHEAIRERHGNPISGASECADETK